DPAAFWETESTQSSVVSSAQTQQSLLRFSKTKSELCTTLGDNSTADSPTASDAGLIDPEQEVISPLVPQPTSVLHCGSQCNLRPFHRSSAVQVQPRMVSVGCQTESPLPSPAHSDDESSSVTMDHPGDMPWSPEEEMMMLLTKFIVCQTQLMSLFTICPSCCGETQGNVEQQEGTYIKIKQVCAACGYERFWQNQPMLYRNMPACNLLLSGAIHFSGCMATQTIRMLKLLGLQCISVGTFFRHQRLYTIPTIVQAWQNEQAGIIRELKEMGGGLILSGDCRSDSPGHCAKYGTYSLIEDRINKVLDLQLVQSSEVPSSTWCELEGLKRSIDFLKEQHMQVSALITDRNRKVAKWVREELCPGGTSHFFDIWHIGKSLGKALDAAAKERECEDLKLTSMNTALLHFPAVHIHLWREKQGIRSGWNQEQLQPLIWRGLLMAALHFNHNSSREVARTRDGEVRYAVRYPRFCKGDWVVRPIKEKPSYAYAAALMESLSEGYSRSPETLRESSAVLSSTAPAPLSTSCQEIAKDEAVGLYLARHSQFNTGN
ncbi:hypothetical protein JOQ06_021619, partial [Pogonophryne albipinna]